MALLEHYIGQSYHPVFIDETHWISGWGRERARVPVGKKALRNYMRRNYALTAISAISDNGPVYTLLLSNTSVDAEKFVDFMRTLLDIVKERKIVFFYG